MPLFTQSPLAGKPQYFGSQVVRGAFILAIFGWGVGFYGPPIYIYAVQQSTSWPLFLVSFAATLHFLIGAFIIAHLPLIYRRFGIAKVTAVGSLTTTFGVIGWAYADEWWHLIVATIFSGAGWVTMGAAAINALISPWYSRTRPKALAKAYNGASIGGVIFSPLWIFLISWLGFKMASIFIGSLMVLVVLTLAIKVFSKTPSKEEMQIDQLDFSGVTFENKTNPMPVSTLWLDKRFLTLAVGMAFGLFAQIGLVAHLFSLLVPKLGAQQSGFAMGFVTVCAISGRSITAAIMPLNADRRLYAIAGYVAQMLGTLTLMLCIESQILMIWIGVALFGLGVGNATSLPPSIAQIEFSEIEVSRVVALIISISQATYSFAPVFFGLMLSVIHTNAETPSQRNSNLFFTTAMGFQLLAIGLFYYGKRKK